MTQAKSISLIGNDEIGQGEVYAQMFDDSKFIVSPFGIFFSDNGKREKRISMSRSEAKRLAAFIVENL